MNTAMLIIYAAALTIIVGAGAMVYRHFAARGRLRAALYGISTASILVLIWPIPIHGGFTIWAEALYDELERHMKRRHDAEEIRRAEVFQLRLQERFAAPLDYDVVSRLSGSWHTVSVTGGRLAWYDALSRLIWSEPLDFPSSAPWPSLAQAKALCRAYPPAGHWALPTEAEQYHFWKAGGATALPHPAASQLAYIVDEDLQTEIPTLSVANRGNANARTDPGPSTATVRCVARGPGAPARGYVKADIPLEEWNRFQLSKLTGGS